MKYYRIYYIDGHGDMIILGFLKSYRAQDALDRFFYENPCFANIPRVKICAIEVAKEENRLFHDGVTRTVLIGIPAEEREDFAKADFL